MQQGYLNQGLRLTALDDLLLVQSRSTTCQDPGPLLCPSVWSLPSPGPRRLSPSPPLSLSCLLLHPLLPPLSPRSLRAHPLAPRLLIQFLPWSLPSPFAWPSPS